MMWEEMLEKKKRKKGARTQRRAHGRETKAARAQEERRDDRDGAGAETEAAAANSSDIVTKRRREEEEKKLRSVRTRSYTQNQGYDVRRNGGTRRPHTTFDEKHIDKAKHAENTQTVRTQRAKQIFVCYNPDFRAANTQRARSCSAIKTHPYDPAEINRKLPYRPTLRDPHAQRRSAARSRRIRGGVIVRVIREGVGNAHMDREHCVDEVM